jgi:AcrR family transcriptional regulator
MHDGTVAPTVTPRFSRKREAIIAAATEILNQRGVRGMTLSLVAERVGLITTSVTYYFKKKDALAAACFDSGIERLLVLVRAARQEASLADRLRRLIALYLDLRGRVAAGEEAAIPDFSDIRALSPATQRGPAAAYLRLFRAVRDLLNAAGGEWMSRGQASARTQILLEQMHWAPAWLSRYDVQDYPRAGERMCDILINGLAVPGAPWRPAPLALGEGAPPTSGRDAFLHAATRLVNQRGYRGASVALISASLNVTKGSFYHHHSAKDDVVSACFDRSFDIVRRAQLAAQALDGDAWLQLTSAAAALVAFQLSSAGPLLRTSALAALPGTIRNETIEQSARLSDRFAAMIADGVAEGSLRPVDSAIAAQMLGATLNAAADLPVILRGVPPPTAVELYARPLFTGLTSR